MTRVLSVLAAATAAVVLAASAVALAAPAAAAERNGSCDSGEFCYFYNSDNAGSVSDFTGSLGDYGSSQPSCYEFKGAGSGQGVCVKNNAASVWNRTGSTVRVFPNSGYAGAYQDFASGAKGNLNSTLKNNDASHLVDPGSSTGQTPRDDYDGDARGFAQDNCTAFAAYRIASRLGHSGFDNYWAGQHWGDAQHWDDAARAAGYTVDSRPVVGGIVVNDVHHSSSDGVLHGHVAYVNKVYSDGSFDVEEYNWNVHLGYGTRSHLRISSGDTAFQHVIHF